MIYRPSMTTPLFGRLPTSELFSRRYYGRNADLNAIESAILLSHVGVMTTLSDLEREMLRNDPAVSGMVFKRCANLARADWDVQPAEVGVDNNRAKQIADSCRVALLRFRGFRQFLYDLAWGAYDGRAANEVNWTITGGPISYWPTGHIWIHPGRLSFGPQRQLRVVERFQQTTIYTQVGNDLDSYEPGKIVQWMPRNFGDYPEREGYGARILYWQFFKRFSWRHRMTLTELFALPWRVVETDAAAAGETLPSPEALDDAEEAVESLGDTTTVALEPGMKLRLAGLPPESAELFKMNSEEVNEEIAKLILMQSNTTDGEMNRASGVVADKQQDVALEWDGSGLAPVITEQLLRPFVELNYGADDLVYTPTFHLRTRPERDRKADLDRAVTVMSLGLPLSEAEVYEKSGYRKPKHGEPVLRQAKPAAGAPSVGPDGKPLPSSGAGVAGAAVGEEDKSGAAGTPADAVQSLLDAFDEDLLNEADSGEDDQEIAASRLELENPIGKVIQPSSANGSPEPLIDKGVKDAARETKAWGAALAASVKGLERETEIYSALSRCAAKLGLEKFSRVVERKMVHGAMLGALDAHYEAFAEAAMKPTAFERQDAAQGIKLGLVPEGSTGIADFATKPFAEAIKAFGQKQIVSRRAFDRLAAGAKHKAFTVAGLARTDMLEAAHDELSKALVEGSDLRGFSRSLAARFEAAGWSPLNPSHVETVFRTNVMGAYSTGRDAQQRQPAVLAARPYWQLVGPNDARTRPTHKAAHGKVLAASDPFWGKTNGTMGFNCRCRRVSRSAADLARLGLSVTTGAELANLPDEGWSLNG